MGSLDFADRKHKKLLLFDVDDTLTLARRVGENLRTLSLCSQVCLVREFQPATPEMISILRELRKHYVIGFVGGSNLSKIQEQLGLTGNNGV